MDRPDPRPGADPDGVRHARTGGRGWPVAVLALLVVAGVVGWRMNAPGEAGRGDGAPSANADVADARGPAGLPGTAAGVDASGLTRATGASASPAAPGARIEGEDPTPDLSDYVLPGEAPTMAQVIDALHQRGIRTGLGAFQPPGTSPPLQGLEVPDGFELPEGYVRHHQATDDGQRIAPILMFHPDLRSIELRGRRVPVPANRVVTPELAPPGMPLRQVRIPPPRDGGGP